MRGGIYLIQGGDQLVELTEQPYDSEDLLQRLLARYPHLLAGKQINPGAPRRWLLVSREAAVPSEESGFGRLALDHLFLDQDGIPTLVEVKRSRDTRIRREVIGQMLDYAANAVAYWPVETIRALFEARCEVQQLDPESELLELVGPEIDAELFWEQVGTNLQVGRIRMVFVADEIPPELQRVVEFLNEQMSQAEVLAVEVKQYVGEGLRSLVPRLIGQTAEAQQKKAVSSREGRKWDEPSFFQELQERKGTNAVDVARAILQWARPRMTEIWWGQGKRSGSFVPILSHKDRDHQLFAVWTYGKVEVYFYWYAYKPPFDDVENRRELLARLNGIPGVSLPDDAIERRPSIPLATLNDTIALEQFLGIFDWVVREIKTSD